MSLNQRDRGIAVRRSRLLVPVVMLVIGLAGCSDPATGVAVSGETTPKSTSGDPGGPFPTGSGKPTGTTNSQSGIPKSPMANVAPCSLLTAAEVAELRAGPSKEETLNNARACSFYEADGFVTGVAIYDELGLDDVVAQGRPKPLTIGKHKAVQSIGGIDTCAISIEVTKTSRVDAQGTARGNEQKSCEIARRVAELVEPKLPTG